MSKVNFTLFHAASLIGKEVGLNADGTLRKKTLGQFSAGSFEVVSVESPSQLATVLLSCDVQTALSPSTPRDGAKSGTVTTKNGRLRGRGGLVRGKSEFGYEPGVGGLVVVDFDGEGQTIETLRNHLVAVCSALESAAMVGWESSSSSIYNGAECVQGVRGLRLYILIESAADIPRFGKVLAARLMLAGHLRIVISKAGSLLVRGLIDEAIFDAGGRLDFVGGAVCRDGLEQRRGAPVVFNDGAGLFDSRSFPDLTPDERCRLASAIDLAKLAKQPEAEAVQRAWLAAREGEMTARLVGKGVESEVAREQASICARQALGGMLTGDFVLTVVEGGKCVAVTVAEVLSDRARFNRLLTLDPLEPDYCGCKVVGILYLDGIGARLFSQAHGGSLYVLRRASPRVELRKGARHEAVIALCDVLGACDDLFMRGGEVVRVTGAGAVVAVSSPLLAQLIGERVRLESWSRSANKLLPADPTFDLCTQVLVRLKGGL